MTRRIAALALGATIMAMPAVALAQDRAADIPGRADVPGRSGTIARSTLGPDPHGKPGVVWSAPTGPGHEHQPILHQGTLLYGTYDGRVLALDPAAGTERWTWQGSRRDRRPRRQRRSCVRRATARACCGRSTSPQVEELWSTGQGDHDGIRRGPPSPMACYTRPTRSATVYGIDPATGEIVWTWEGPVPIQSLTVVDGAGYFGGTDGRVFSVSVADGTERWRPVQLLFPSVSSSGVVDGWLYVSSNQGIGATGGELYAIDGDTGLVRWRFRTPSGGVIGPSSVADGIAYSATERDGLYALRCAHRRTAMAR